MVRLSARVVWVAAMMGAAAGLIACADILGIDDGTPRVEEDASVDVVQPEQDAVAADVPPSQVVGPPAPPYSPLSCGKFFCNAITQACCSHKKTVPEASPVYSYDCIEDDGGTCSGQLVTCDRTENCEAQGYPGMVCCASTTAPQGLVSCTPPEECDYPEAGLAWRLCEPGDDELCEPDSGKACLPSNSAAVGWRICK